MVSDILWSVAKYLLMLLIGFIIYFVYYFIYSPWALRNKYSKYPNVDVGKKFYPIVGDLGAVAKRRSQNQYQFYDHIETALNKNWDLKLLITGCKNNFEIISPEAMQETIRLWPDKLDRYTSQYYPLWYILKGSLLLIPSTKNWKERRSEATKLIGINNMSKYVPMMVRLIDKVLIDHSKGNSWSKSGDETNLTILVKQMSFQIICKILFGRDTQEDIKYIDYVDRVTGEVVRKTFEAAWYQLAADIVSHLSSVKANLFPFLEKYNLIYPFIATNKNWDTFRDKIREFCENSKDKESVYNQMLNTGKFEKVDVWHDIIGLLGAGMDTTSTAAASALYLLKKNPQKMQKLLNELSKIGLDFLQKPCENTENNIEKDQPGTIESKDDPQRDENFLSEKELREVNAKIQKWDYLTYVVKETLRMDNSAYFSIKYIAKQDIQIKGVPLRKGTLISFNTLGHSFSHKQWQRPTEFLPERFDPEDPLFSLPGGKGMRHPLAWCPFTAGQRSCPGQTMALLEMKVILARVLMRCEYSIRQDLLDNDKAMFGMHSQMDVIGDIRLKI
jgi:cytochrome P450